MPSLVRKIAIYATVNGLILQPADSRSQRTPGLQINYSTHEVTPRSSVANSDTESSPSLDVHGIIGILDVASVGYLISISQRQQVAQVQGVPIYVVTEVVLLPLASQSEAEKVILQANQSRSRESRSQNEQSLYRSDTSDDDYEQSEDDSTEESACPLSPTSEPQTVPESKTPPAGLKTNTGVAHDIVGRKGQYGRFAERWFSKEGSSVQRQKVLGMSTDGDENSISSTTPGLGLRKPYSLGSTTEGLPDGTKLNKSATRTLLVDKVDTSISQGVTNILLPKLVRTTKLLMGSRSFFFSYECDITRRLGWLESVRSDIPIHRSVDPLFFWNRHLIKPFIEGRHHAFILPLMQGFVGQREFVAKQMPKPFLKADAQVPKQNQTPDDMEENQTVSGEQAFIITLISRRSIMRPGLRYLRRGIDEDGYVANSVETEQILSTPSWVRRTGRVYSFVQTRGSIPLFFSQSPYSFKPMPTLQHSYETNHIAFRRHFKDLTTKYGGLQIVSLINKNGGEAELGKQYEKHFQLLNEEIGIGGRKFGFEWFDFHERCRGFNYANLGLLMDSLRGALGNFGFTIVASGITKQYQAGVIRTNCMDCLDRTNVVQSACAQVVLQKQLKEEGFEVNLQTDSNTQWFNTLWADNGDSISIQYSSTGALKGDYTRTRKRNYRGAIKDFGLTLSRYFNNIVNDYFSQAAIDYLLGNVTSQVFEEFEAEMMNGDPAMSMRKVRLNAVDASSKIVVADPDEEFLGGWTLLSPREENTVRTFPFEEVVLLLTDIALYAVRFDWNIEKVSSFERVNLQSISGIVRGVYITSTLATGQMDKEKNVGFVIKYRPSQENIGRVNTRSLSTSMESDRVKTPGRADRDAEQVSVSIKNNLEAAFAFWTGRDATPTFKILAFKALPARSSLVHVDGEEAHRGSEKEAVACICEEIEQASFIIRHGKRAARSTDPSVFIEDREIISLSEAKKSTGLLEYWSHALKKFIWA